MTSYNDHSSLLFDISKVLYFCIHTEEFFVFFFIIIEYMKFPPKTGQNVKVILRLKLTKK
jgi:hypothetical protein